MENTISKTFSKLYPNMVNGIVIKGSSGLYENSMGNTYPRRGYYDYIKRKTEEVERFD